MAEVQIHGDKRAMIYTVAGVFMGLEILAVLLRFFARRMGRVHWKDDDWFIYLGLFWTMTLNILIMMYVRYGGVGLHQAYVEQTEPEMLIYFAKSIPPLAIVWVLAATFPKLAVLKLYMKLFAIKREARIICYATGVVLIGNCIGTIVAGLCICMPLRYLWDQSIPGHCIQINQYYRWVRLPNVLSDLVILALPVPHILRLQTTRKMKLGLLITFLLGGIGFVAALITWIEYFTTNAIADKTWSAAKILPWSVVEVDMYVIAACLLSYKPLVSWLWTGAKQKLIPFRSMATACKASKGRSWPGTNQASVNKSQEEEDWLQLVSKDQVSRPTSEPEVDTRIRVEHRILVTNQSLRESNNCMI